MLIEVDLAGEPGGNIRLREPEEFSSFAVSVIGRGDVASALEQLGRPDGTEHVFVPVRKVEELAGPLGLDPRWRAGLESMLAVAQRLGWTDGAGRIRAHLK